MSDWRPPPNPPRSAAQGPGRRYPGGASSVSSRVLHRGQGFGPPPGRRATPPPGAGGTATRRAVGYRPLAISRRALMRGAPLAPGSGRRFGSVPEDRASSSRQCHPGHRLRHRAGCRTEGSTVQLVHGQRRTAHLPEPDRGDVGESSAILMAAGVPSACYVQRVPAGSEPADARNRARRHHGRGQGERQRHRARCRAFLRLLVAFGSPSAPPLRPGVLVRCCWDGSSDAGRTRSRTSYVTTGSDAGAIRGRCRTHLRRRPKRSSTTGSMSAVTAASRPTPSTSSMASRSARCPTDGELLCHVRDGQRRALR